MITLFHIPGSSSFAAHCALEESELPYELVEIDRLDRTAPPAFVETTPTGRVPALRDGDAGLHECGAVLLWIAERSGEGTGPVDPADRADLLRWLFWTANTYHPSYEGFFVPTHLSDDESAHDGIRAKSLVAIEACGSLLERRLDGRDWIAGTAFTVADLYVYMLTGWASYLPDGGVGGPALEAHFARVGARPAVARVRDAEGLDERLQRRS